MAQMLMREWRLAVLRVELNLTERQPTVDINLLRFPDGVREVIYSWSEPPDAFGLPLTGREIADAELSVHAPLSSEIADLMGADPFYGEAALWLHLTKPHGYLGAIPWERDLLEYASYPVIRLPDRLPITRRPDHTFNIAVVVGDQFGDSTWAIEYLWTMLEQLIPRVPRSTEVHIFADRSRHAEFIEFANQFDRSELVVHDPATADDAVAESAHRAEKRAERGSRTTRPRRSQHEPGRTWAAWLGAEMRSRSASAVIALGGAALDGDEPALRLTASPNAQDATKTSTPVSPSELASLADQLGAAIFCVVNSPHEPQLAARMLADHLGVDRPGPTLFSAAGSGADGLDPGYALANTLCALVEPETDQPLLGDRSLFGYLQPSLIESRLSETFPATDDEATEHEQDEVTQRSTQNELEAVPAWVGAADRFIDTTRADLAGVRKTAGLQDVTMRAYTRGTANALHELERMVARHVEAEFDLQAGGTIAELEP